MPVVPVMIGLTLAVGVVVVLLSARGTEARKAGPAASPERRAGTRSADRAPTLTRLLSLAGRNHSMQQELLAAGLLVRPSELAAVSLGLTALLFVAAFLVGQSVPVALAASILGLLAPPLAVRQRVASRRMKCQRQLPEVLELIATALRSGYSLPRALELVARQMGPPVSDEAQRVVDELAVGVSLDEALDNLSRRQGSYEIKLFTAAVQIQTRVGGNLAEMLIKTAAMVRQRAQLAGEIAALTAEGRLSAGILAALPVLLALAVARLSPGYLAPLITDPLGRYLCVAGVLLMVSGLVMIRRLITVDL